MWGKQEDAERGREKCSSEKETTNNWMGKRADRIWCVCNLNYSMVNESETRKTIIMSNGYEKVADLRGRENERKCPIRNKTSQLNYITIFFHSMLCCCCRCRCRSLLLARLSLHRTHPLCHIHMYFHGVFGIFHITIVVPISILLVGIVVRTIALVICVQMYYRHWFKIASINSSFWMWHFCALCHLVYVGCILGCRHYCMVHVFWFGTSIIIVDITYSIQSPGDLVMAFRVSNISFGEIV